MGGGGWSLYLTIRRRCAGRSRLLRSLRHYLWAQSQGRDTIDRLEERGVDRGSARRSSLKGQEWDEHWNPFKGNVEETSERQSGARRYHLELSWSGHQWPPHWLLRIGGQGHREDGVNKQCFDDGRTEPYMQTNFQRDRWLPEICGWERQGQRECHGNPGWSPQQRSRGTGNQDFSIEITAQGIQY